MIGHRETGTGNGKLTVCINCHMSQPEQTPIELCKTCFNNVNEGQVKRKESLADGDDVTSIINNIESGKNKIMKDLVTYVMTFVEDKVGKIEERLIVLTDEHNRRITLLEEHIDSIKKGIKKEDRTETGGETIKNEDKGKDNDDKSKDIKEKEDKCKNEGEEDNKDDGEDEDKETKEIGRLIVDTSNIKHDPITVNLQLPITEESSPKSPSVLVGSGIKAASEQNTENNSDGHTPVVCLRSTDEEKLNSINNQRNRSITILEDIITPLELPNLDSDNEIICDNQQAADSTRSTSITDDMKLNENTRRIAILEDNIDSIKVLMDRQNSMNRQNSLIRQCSVNRQCSHNSESEDQDERQEYILIHGLTEEILKIDSAVFETDEQKLKIIFALIKCTFSDDNELPTFTRQGNPNPSYIRTIKMNITCPALLEEILKSTKLLNDADRPWNNVHIKKYLNPVEVQEQNRLRMKRKSKERS